MNTRHQIVDSWRTNASDVALMEGELQKAGLDFALYAHTRSEAEFVAAITEMPPGSGDRRFLACPSMTVCGRSRSCGRSIRKCPFILVSGTIGEEKVVELMKQGATDYVPRGRLRKSFRSGGRAKPLREAGRKKMSGGAPNWRGPTAKGRFRALFESAGAGIAIEDLQGRIIETNRALQQMLGYDTADLQHLTRREFTHSKDLKEETAHFNRLLAGKSDHYRVEKRLRYGGTGGSFWGRA